MKFLSVGLQPTFQDLGRVGFQSSGVNPDGVMDTYSMRLLNILLRNSENEGVLEMNFPAPKLLFEENSTICIGGADFGVTLNDQPVSLFKTENVSAGDVLKFSKKVSGERVYLAVKGGFALNRWLESVSYNQTLKLPSPSIKKGLSIGLKTNEQVKKLIGLGRKLVDPELNSRIRFLAAPEYEMLTAEAKQVLEVSSFQLTTEVSRMGYRLQGEPLNVIPKASLLSSAVTFGTMQLLPDGHLIVLMASHQTTGGYPRIGTIIAVDLPRLAQSGPHQIIHFERVSQETAERLYLASIQQLHRLKASISVAFNESK